MPREVIGPEGISWSCVEAYAGLSDEGGGGAAARADDGDSLAVVCTPSGGAKSVRLELPPGWETDIDEEVLLREVESNRET